VVSDRVIRCTLVATHFAVSAAQRATTTIPIVMVVSANPLERNHVHDLAQPEANITGTVTSFEAVEDKRLQLLQEAIPKVNRVAFLWNNKNIEVSKRLQTLGLPLGLRVIPIPFARPADLVPALHSGLEGKPEALLIQTDPITFDLRSTIITFALENRLPSFFGFTDDARDGGLIAYGVDLRNEYRRGAPYVDKILKGAKPSELPVDQSTQYQLVVNLKTARALGLDVPASIVARADELVE
jgi:putative ABC transport system substrate-binding protein